MAKKKINLPTDEEELQKLSLYISIVQSGVGLSVTKIFQSFDSSLIWTSHGEGTASKSVYEILGLSDKGKDIVFSVVKSDDTRKIQDELDTFFELHKRNAGVAFAIPFKAIVSRKAYNLLLNLI